MFGKKVKTLVIGALAGLALAGCQGQNAGTSGSSTSDKSASDEYRIAMVTDGNGIDDRSFNQSAWEGMEKWAKDHGFSENARSFYQSHSEADFIPNLSTATADNYNIVFGIGSFMVEPIQKIAENNPDQHYGLVDGQVDLPNVVSLAFKDNESAYLAGVAAAKSTKKDKVGFIGGMKIPGIERFEAGFKQGVKDTKPEVKVDVQYADSFGDAARGQQISSSMYQNGIDIIFTAAGQTGNGAFTETRNRLENGEKGLWIIGCDRDQSSEGEWSQGNFTLASTLKLIGTTIAKVTDQSMSGDFPGGQSQFNGVKEGAVDLVDTNLDDEAKAAVNEAREGIKSDKITVPEKLADLK
ncbi:BMP family lipoprotein [Aerococcus urinae]